MVKRSGALHPREVPSIRDELAAHLNHPKTRGIYRHLGQSHGWLGHRPAPTQVSDAILDAERGMLRMGELFYVSADMTDVAEVAASTLPAFSLRREDLPAERGLLVFDRPIGAWTDANGRTAAVIACSWAPGIPRLFPPDYLVVNFYTWRDFNMESAIAAGLQSDELAFIESQPRLIHDNEAGFRLGVEHEHPPTTTILGTWGRTLLASWLLMQQPGVATREPYAYNRQDQAWMKRRRIKQSPVTIVRLRYAKQESGADGAALSREYHHRWMVRGHWRKQWYPSRGAHVPIWISPHIKGPEGAPVKTGERVNAWVR